MLTAKDPRSELVRVRPFLFFSTFLCIMTPVYACLVIKPLTKVQIEKADIIFEGRAMSVRTPTCTGICDGKIVGPRSIVFQIDKIIKGKMLNDQIEVYWQNGTFGEVDNFMTFRLQYGFRSKVGIITAETINKAIRCETIPAVTGLGKSTTIEKCETSLPLPFLPKANSTTDKPWIISDICSESYVMPVEK